MQCEDLRNRQRGLSLVEMCVTVAAIAVLAGTVLPSLERSNKKRLLNASAGQLDTDSQLARSEAIARNEGVRVSFHAMSGGAWSFTPVRPPTADTSCSADAIARCAGGAALIKSSHLAASSDIAVTSTVASMRFDEREGNHCVKRHVARARLCRAAGGYRRCARELQSSGPTGPGPEAFARACLVSPIDLDVTDKTSAAYGARVAVWSSAGRTLATRVGRYRLCRDSADDNPSGGVRVASGSGATSIDNREHSCA